MSYKSFLNKLIFLIFISLVVIGCSKAKDTKTTNEQTEQVIDTGVISAESYPGGAQVYVGLELKGETPLMLYNFPIGKYEITVKKNGYADFKKSISLEVGKTEEIKAALSEINTAPAKETIENKPETGKLPENTAPSSKFNKVNVSSSFITYYDFKNGKFTESTSASPDVFSSNYKTYLYFIAIAPSKMRVLSKQIKDIRKEDCMNAGDTIANLYSGQTLCVIATDGAYAAIGGSWTIEPTVLEWRMFS